MEGPLGDALTRSEFLRRGGLVVVAIGAGPAFLAGCGAEEAAPEVGGTIDYLSWEGYDLKGVEPMDEWRKANAIELRSSYVGTHDDIQAKLKAGAPADYDLITYYQGFIDLYRKLEILTPIDEGQVPNIERMFPFFREGEASDRFWKIDGVRWGVPFTWGTTTLDYRSDRIDPPESWFDLLEPEFKGKVGWVPDATAAFVQAGVLLGFDVPNYTPAQFEECGKLLRRFRAQIRGFAPTFGDLASQFVAGEIVASFNGWAAVGVFARQKGVKTVKSTIPKEGSFSFCDSYAIPPTVNNVDTVHAFINQALTPEVQAAQAEFLSAGIVTPDAEPLLSEEVAKLYPLDRLEEHLELAPFFPNAPVEKVDDTVTRGDWMAEWLRIQAGE
jgi:spermidine/putrescine transport system substrate-binding protein